MFNLLSIQYPSETNKQSNKNHPTAVPGSFGFRPTWHRMRISGNCSNFSPFVLVNPKWTSTASGWVHAFFRQKTLRKTCGGRVQPCPKVCMFHWLPEGVLWRVLFDREQWFETQIKSTHNYTINSKYNLKILKTNKQVVLVTVIENIATVVPKGSRKMGQTHHPKWVICLWRVGVTQTPHLRLARVDEAHLYPIIFARP